MSSRPTILIIVGYFDWFSGYQETGLARALTALADVEVLCGNRVNPLFTDEHLTSIGAPRIYPVGTTHEHGVSITRVKVREWRSMLWTKLTRQSPTEKSFDLVIQMMPGQLLPLLATPRRRPRSRVVLYGDNQAMYADLSRWKARVKETVFAVTKGSLYRHLNRGADVVFCYTPNTVGRIEPFSAGSLMEVLPLAYDPNIFYLDASLRAQARGELGAAEDDIILVAPGKLQAQKRLDAVVNAMSQLPHWRKRLRLVLVGGTEGPVAEAIRNAARVTGLNERVTLLPFADARRLNMIFNAADLGVWPLMPAITIQQSMGTGLPVLLPDNDLVSHLVRPSTGWLYSPERSDPTAALAHSLSTALNEISDSDRPLLRRERAKLNAWLGTPALAERLIQTVSLGATR